MSVIKVDFVGIRTSRLNETVAMFRDLLGVPVVRQTDRLVGFRLGDNTVLELSLIPLTNSICSSSPDRSSRSRLKVSKRPAGR